MKIMIRRVLNLLLYLSFCVMFGTGLMLANRLVPGSRGGRGLEVLGWDRHQWGDLHAWVGYGFVGLIAVHLILNWSWLVKCAASGRAWRLFAGLAVGAAIVATFILLPVEHREKGRHRSSYEPVVREGDFAPISSPSAEAPLFQKDIYPVLAASCLRCHGPKKQAAGLRLDQRAALLREHGPLVIPGKSEQSPLVAIVSGAKKTKKSAKEHLLPSGEVALIKAWIDAGAP